MLIGGNAVGEKLLPLVVFKGKNVWDSWVTKDEFPGMTYAATRNGWMEAQTFENYFKNHFLKNIPPKRPVVLIYDGHSFHVGISLVERALAADVVILKLPPHAIHILQPMDLCVFKSLKLLWDEEIIKWDRKKYGVKLPKAMFSSIISKVWSLIKPEIIRKGFEKAGIFPFCGDIVPVECYEPEMVQH